MTMLCPSAGRLTIAATALSAAIGISAAANQSFAQDSVAISGTFDCTYTHKNVSSVGRVEDGHILMLDACKGKNTNRGASDYMDGASILNQDISDLAQGNGPQTGYTTFTKGAAIVRIKHEGQVATTLHADKTPNTTFDGKWTVVSGAGKYAGTTGGGTYTGKMTSKDTLQIDWTGSYSIEGQSAAATK